jgi:hypothetical protein
MLFIVELYSRSQILNGRIVCPDNFRILDLFNGVYSKCDFVEFIPFSDALIKGGIYQDGPREFISKTAVEFLTVSDFNLARGCGGNANWKTYPVVQKLPVSVSLHMQSDYTLFGKIHLRPGQDIRNVLNGDIQFLPMTEVTIIRNNHIYGERPFAIINKEYIFSSEEIKSDIEEVETRVNI